MLALKLKGKYSSEMSFKQLLYCKVLTNAMICFTLWLCNNFQGREKRKNIPLHKSYSVQFPHHTFSTILRVLRDRPHAELFKHISNYIFIKNCPLMID